MRTILKIVIILFFVASLIVLLKALFLSSYPDFSAYYYNPQMVFNGENPYIGGTNLYTPTTYPPFSFILFAPASLFSFELAGKLITSLSIVLLLTSLVLIFIIEKIKVKSYLFLFIAALVFSYFPVKFTLGMGQINIFVLFFFTLFLYFLKMKKGFLAGLFIALSLLTKLFPLLIFPYLFHKKEYKLLTYAFLIIFAVVGLSFMLISGEINIFFYQKIFPSFLNSWQSDYYNQSISGILSRSISDIQVRLIFKQLFVIIMLIASILILRKSKLKNISFEVGYLVTVMLLINGFSWQHHFTWLILPLIITLFFLVKKRYHKFYYILLFIAYFLTAINFSSPSSLPVLIQSHVFFGTLLLWILDSILILKTSAVSSEHYPKKLSPDE